MKTAALLIIFLSNNGYVLSEHDARVTLAWTVAKHDIVDAELLWELSAGTVRITGGRTAVHRDDGATLTVRMPRVRARTELVFSYRLLRKGRNELLETGLATLHVFPPGLLRDVAASVAGRRLIVVDRDDAPLPAALSEAGVVFERLPDAASLPTRKPDMVLIGPDVLKHSPFEQGPLTALAERGCGVLIFQQSAVDHLIGYAIAARVPAVDMEVETSHPLLRGLERDDVRSWFRSPSEKALPAVQLPREEAAKEIIYWPREAPGGEAPAPIDALLLSKATGEGRVVLCQLPLGDVRTDPRSQVFLGNVIEYLLTRPEPTPPPSQRVVVTRPSSASQPTIAIPSGVSP